ncbi:DUF4393 domain-containing protein [Nocardioides sp. B-3]|uniref:DUF4393 domain-containing protein n=1 Tax=Nocardioides sp. B-3 TaxID=2895565 RepID=UPI0021530FB7|nr:DUF4393 domain-containing protein [Nocardioides sp. B-3]UUZ61458.1 DUF4393 domain-containing protein [Nocardioides sp. B-3]
MSAGAPLPVIPAQIGDSFGELADPVLAPGQKFAGQLQSTGHRVMRRVPSLRERGNELLERSRDVWRTDSAHPAYERILDELAPDEARVLVLLMRGGPQPSVDVRTGGAVGMVSSTLVKPGLTMIGPRAGCRYVDRVPSYLHNLFRLGMVWFSRELVKDPMEYQGARGPARRDRGDEVGAAREGVAALDQPHAVRRGLLPRRAGGRWRCEGPARPRTARGLSPG